MREVHRFFGTTFCLGLLAGGASQQGAALAGYLLGLLFNTETGAVGKLMEVRNRGDMTLQQQHMRNNSNDATKTARRDYNCPTNGVLPQTHWNNLYACDDVKVNFCQNWFHLSFSLNPSFF